MKKRGANLIIRTAANEHEIEQAIETYWANEPPPNASHKTMALAHWQALFASCPEGFWIAEAEATQQIIGVATAVRRPPQWVLANFYVLPAYHGQGIGKQLLSRAFATREGCERFAVHASAHPSAQSLYMQFGMYPQPYSNMLKGRPRDLPVVPSNLTAQEHPVGEILSTLNTLDQQALGFIRAVDHQAWGKHGSHFLVTTGDQIAGYFRVSAEGFIGPLVVSDSRWMIPVLNLALRKQIRISAEEHEVFVPGANRDTLAFLLAHGYRYAEVHLLLSSHPMPGLAQVIFHDTDLL
jgi:GNAT superfamily N-acetyltransferase